MSELQDALSEALGELSSKQGAGWALNGELLVGAVSGDLVPVEPQMKGTAQRTLQVRIPLATAPATLPKKGDELTSAGRFYGVISTYPDHAAGVAIITVRIP